MIGPIPALKALLDRYVGLVNCGDCGKWNPELESEVIDARAVIARYENKQTVFAGPEDIAREKASRLKMLAEGVLARSDVGLPGD